MLNVNIVLCRRRQTNQWIVRVLKHQILMKIKICNFDIFSFRFVPHNSSHRLEKPRWSPAQNNACKQFSVISQLRLKLKSLGHVITLSSSPTQSTPLPTRLMERKAILTNGDACLQTCDLELSSKALPHVRSSTLAMRCNIVLLHVVKCHRVSAGATAIGWDKEVSFTTTVPQGVNNLCQPGGQEPSSCKWVFFILTVKALQLMCNVVYMLLMELLTSVFHRHRNLGQGSSPPVMEWHLAPPPPLRDRLSLHPPLGELWHLHSFRISSQ